MAKKQTKVSPQANPGDEHVEKVVVKTPPVVDQPKVETPVLEKILPKKEKNDWTIKPRTYLLKGNKRPLSKMIRSAGIYFFDEKKGYERELKYCENQQTCFVDEMKGEQRMSHVIFRNGE